LTVAIRVADPDDTESLARLHLRVAVHAYRDIFPPDAPQPELVHVVALWTKRIDECAFVAEIDGAIVGGVAAGEGELSGLYVDTEQWGSGIGTQLHDRVLLHLREHGHRVATLWVLERNVRARQWYERLGWCANGGRITTYAPGVDELSYERPL
jgi:ribosomal protein S18 acetylase RimI-like enzyme